MSYYVQDESLDYECVLDIENESVVVDASVDPDPAEPSVFFITCRPHQVGTTRRRLSGRFESSTHLQLPLFLCFCFSTSTQR